MNNIYLKKLFTLHGIGIIILCILLHIWNNSMQSYIMNYFMFDKLTSKIDIGSFDIKISSIISITIALLINGICNQITSSTLLESLKINM
jgi:hypothetical protein